MDFPYHYLSESVIQISPNTEINDILNLKSNRLAQVILSPAHPPQLTSNSFLTNVLHYPTVWYYPKVLAFLVACFIPWMNIHYHQRYHHGFPIFTKRVRDPNFAQ